MIFFLLSYLYQQLYSFFTQEWHLVEKIKKNSCECLLDQFKLIYRGSYFSYFFCQRKNIFSILINLVNSRSLRVNVVVFLVRINYKYAMFINIKEKQNKQTQILWRYQNERKQGKSSATQLANLVIILAAEKGIITTILGLYN